MPPPASTDPVKAYVDLACRADDGTLLLLGWVYDSERRVQDFALLTGDADGAQKVRKLLPGVDGSELVRVPRPDVVHALSVPEELAREPFGFLLVVPGTPVGAGLALVLEDGRQVRLPFTALDQEDEMRRGLAAYQSHYDSALLAVLGASVGARHQLTQMVRPTSRFHIECAIRLNHGLILVGWSTAGGEGKGGPGLHLEDAEGYEQSTSFSAGDGRILLHSFRPDLKDILAPDVFGRGRHGFVFHWPGAMPEASPLMARMDGCAKTQTAIPLLSLDAVDAVVTLRRIWSHAGSLLIGMAAGLEDEPRLRARLDEIESEACSESGQSFASCDQAFLLNNRALVLNGWIAMPAREVERIELLTPQEALDITARVRRYMRPDLIGAYPWSAAEPLGFIAVLEDEAALSCNARLRIVSRDGQNQMLQAATQVTDWAGLAAFINQQNTLAQPLLAQLAATVRLEDDAGRLAGRTAWLRRGHFQARHRHLPRMIEQPEMVIASIDRTYVLGDAGVLVFGWQLLPWRRPLGVSVRDADGHAVDVTGRMVPLLRLDVAQGDRVRFPVPSDWCGFVCLAPLPTRPGEARALCYDFGDLGEVWLQLPTDTPPASGVALVKQILTTVPSPDSLRNNLYELFSRGLGHAVEAVGAARPPFEGPVEVRQFGEPPPHPETTVIVPLYGRFDFLRHQLAQFVDDPDFAGVDLIYVVDDPSIVAPTLELAAKYHALFDLPFRVCWYGQNRGFAGANNIGAGLARGDYLVLLNSDVIPQHKGWLAQLRAALDTLPDAGAVGPLLEFGDGTIQHAGMYPRRDDLLPGFLLNSHKGMGTIWHGGDTAREVPMLTAACLMLRTRDYRDVGGLDEGYIVGDFEDSDLCLALRKRGKRTWLAPGARLWHLERQSQTLGDAVDVRQLLTLFNGWRYHEKIRAGLLADPARLELPE